MHERPWNDTQCNKLVIFRRWFGSFSTKAYYFGPLNPTFWYAIGESISFLCTNSLKMISNQPNLKFLGGGLGCFHQKHIILTLSTRRFNTQSKKAYHFCERTASKWYAVRWIGNFQVAVWAVFTKSILFWRSQLDVLIRNRKKHIISVHERP